MNLPDDAAIRLIEYMEEACSLLDDYGDFIRDNHDAVLNKKISMTIVHLSEMQELLNRSLRE